jgi:hypothetical protein
MNLDDSRNPIQTEGIEIEEISVDDFDAIIDNQRNGRAYAHS